jgi:outer membrane protein assembly factor BamB
MNNRRSLAVFVAGLLCCGAAFGDGPSYFRHDSGLIGDKHPLPDDFEKDARLEWRTPLEPGVSTPCISGDTIYLTTFETDNRELATIALDRASGALRWKQVCPAETIEPYHATGSPASSTIASNGDQVFAFFGSYGMLSYDRDGELLWEKRMGPFQDEFGASSSPVLVDQLILLNEDHDVGSALIAIDQRTGETVWETPRDGFTRSYSTPLILERDGAPQVVVAGALQLAGYDVQDGQKLWWVNGLSRIVDSSPTLADGALYVATWTPGGDQSERIAMEPFPEAIQNYDRNGDKKIEKSELPRNSPVVPRFFRIDLNQDEKLDAAEWDKHAVVFERARNVAIRVVPGGNGDVTNTNVKWVHRRGLPTVPSSVVYEGALYMVKDGGIITSLDAETGESLRTARAPAGRGNYYASLVAGDGKVYLCSERGVVTVLEAGRKWQILSSHDFGERIMATPVVADGKMFIRSDEALYCFSKS